MAITDTAVHDIDIARFLLDDEPSPSGRRAATGMRPDPLLTLIEMRSGALVTIETSVHIAFGYDIRGEVIGETGTVSLAEQSDVIVKAKGAYSGHVPGDWPERFDAAFDAEFRAWLSAAAKGGAAGPSAWDGYVATAATLAGVRALESGGRESIELREKPLLYA
jgi:myo-inositol 2-dehydrogenase / D-chiro-inositol 1-dehydrogenase